MFNFGEETKETSKIMHNNHHFADEDEDEDDIIYKMQSKS
jgi:hypothetical protein